MSWPVVTLGEVAETALGKMLDKGKRRGLPMVPYLRNVNVQWGGISTDDLLEMELADDDRARFGIEAGDLLVCEGGEIGRCAIWSGRADYIAYQKALHRVRPSEWVDIRFLRYLFEFHSTTGTLAKFATGSTIAHLPQQQLRKLPVPLPAVDEQRRIVEILEDHLWRLDAAARNLKTASRRLKALESSLLERYFAGGELVPLDTMVTDISAGKSFGTANAPAADGEWGIIKVSAMTWGEFKPEENKAVSAGNINPRFEIHEGDLLVSRANTADYVGASVLVGAVRQRLLLSDKSLRLTPANDIDSEWLWRALQAPSARRQLTNLATGTKDSMRNISQVALRRVMLPRRDKSMQMKALDAYRGGSSAAASLQGQLIRNERMLQQLRTSLLTAAFSGRLTRDRQHLDTEELVSL